MSPEPAPKHHRTDSPSPLHVETDNQIHVLSDDLSDEGIAHKRPCLDRSSPDLIQRSAQYPTTIPTPPSPSPPSASVPQSEEGSDIHSTAFVTAPPAPVAHATPLPTKWGSMSKKARQMWRKRHS